MDKKRGPVEEANRIANFLASMPCGNSTTTRRVVRELMLSTGGQMLMQGELRDIVATSLGAGVYRITTRRHLYV